MNLLGMLLVFVQFACVFLFFFVEFFPSGGSLVLSDIPSSCLVHQCQGNVSFLKLRVKQYLQKSSVELV